MKFLRLIKTLQKHLYSYIGILLTMKLAEHMVCCWTFFKRHMFLDLCPTLVLYLPLSTWLPSDLEVSISLSSVSPSSSDNRWAGSTLSTLPTFLLGERACAAYQSIVRPIVSWTFHSVLQRFADEQGLHELYRWHITSLFRIKESDWSDLKSDRNCGGGGEGGGF